MMNAISSSRSCPGSEISTSSATAGAEEDGLVKSLLLDRSGCSRGVSGDACSLTLLVVVIEPPVVMVTDVPSGCVMVDVVVVDMLMPSGPKLADQHTLGSPSGFGRA